MLYTIGSQTGVHVPPGVRKVVQGVRGENISAITENGRNSQNVPFETTFRRKHHFVHQNRPNSLVFFPARLYFFLINTTLIRGTGLRSEEHTSALQSHLN